MRICDNATNSSGMWHKTTHHPTLENYVWVTNTSKHPTVYDRGISKTLYELMEELSLRAGRVLRIKICNNATDSLGPTPYLLAIYIHTSDIDYYNNIWGELKKIAPGTDRNYQQTLLQHSPEIFRLAAKKYPIPTEGGTCVAYSGVRK